MNVRSLLFSNRISREIIVWVSDLFPIQDALWVQFQKYLKESWPSRERVYSKSDVHRLYRDFLRVYMREGFNLVDYFSYSFISLSAEERNTYISERDRGKFHRIANDEKFNSIIADKVTFNSMYEKYVHRDWMVVNSEKDRDIFLTFVNRHSKVVIKPRDGQKGRGIEFFDVKSIDDKEKIWGKVLEERLLIEEAIQQDISIASFHPESVNTIRISTAIDKERKVHIMAAVIRVGSGNSNVDNGSAGGLFAGIDIATGTIISPGIDLKARKFLNHPTTGKPFLGFVIPKWDELLKLAEETALIIPQLRYIGWDWVLTNKGNWELLEGNEPGGVHILQQGVGRGLKKEYTDVLIKG